VAPRFSHIALSVVDLERSIRFYGDLFGVRAGTLYEIRGRRASDLMEIDDIDSSGMFLLCEGVYLELLAHGRRESSGAVRAPEDLGVAHLSFVVDDLPSTVAAVLAHGGTLRTETTTGFGSGGSSAIAFVEDPEGNRIELISHSSADEAEAHSGFLGAATIGWPPQATPTPSDEE
jgi:catechol 2,3-dioxygenase-like lactoylglutathione lyase family enzyme